jgi:hypothetical protein
VVVVLCWDSCCGSGICWTLTTSSWCVALIGTDTSTFTEHHDASFGKAFNVIDEAIHSPDSGAHPVLPLCL